MACALKLKLLLFNFDERSTASAGGGGALQYCHVNRNADGIVLHFASEPVIDLMKVG